MIKNSRSLSVEKQQKTSKNFNKSLIYYLLLFIFLTLFLVVRNNLSNIYVFLGTNYEKLNNVTASNKWYEKAFKAGVNDVKLREKYVKSTINSSVGVDGQQKLTDFLKLGINDYVTMQAEGYLYRLKREADEQYPLNYILQAPYNQRIMHWGKPIVTYNYRNITSASKEQIEGIEEAFSEWQNVSKGKIKFQKVDDNGDIIVDLINQGSNELEYGKKYVVAYTTPIVSSDKLKNMIIKFNVKDINGKQYTKNQIYNTGLHEIFHALGFMGHSFDKHNIMHISNDNIVHQNNEKLSLTQADISTFELLYDIKPDITNSNENNYKYIPSVIVGNSEDINYFKSREAENYIYKAPSLPNGYLDLAETLINKKEYKEGIGNLKKALNLADNDDIRYICYYNLAVSYFYDEEYDKALKYAHLANQINDELELHFLKAEIYLKQDDKKNAEKEYLYLIEKDKTNIEYVVNLANIYIKQYKYLKARKVIKTFLKNNPNEKDNPHLKGYSILKL